MINWILSQPWLMKFINKNPKKQNTILLEHQNKVNDIRNEISQRLIETQRCGELISTMRENDLPKTEISRERDRMKQSVASVYKALADYTRRLLWLELHRSLSINGFVMPEKLVDFRSDIDYGLLNLDGLSGLEDVLNSDPDPFDELEINLSEFM